MDSIEALHTAVRRYCIDRYRYWSVEYGSTVAGDRHRIGSGYTDEALSIFPRYNVMDAVRIEVEKQRPADFKSLKEAKDFFILAALQAQSQFTQKAIGSIDAQAIDEERKRLVEYIENQTETELAAVEALFYRRVLSESEEKEILKSLASRWKITDKYWYPLSLEKPENVEAFQDAYFEREVGYDFLIQEFEKRKVDRIFEIREYGASFEIERTIFKPTYNGAEGIWCSLTFDWVIYVSHESSITFSGWILKNVQDAWPNWKDRIWTSPFFS